MKYLEKKTETYVIPMNVQKATPFGFFLFDGMELEEVIIFITGIIVGISLFAILKQYSLLKAIFAPLIIIGLVIMLVKPSGINQSLYRELKQHLKYKKGQKLYKYTQL